ncbi:MAG: hypothetical protein A3B47_03595 [Candidatus Levybacteria bacterium RIFCSPLOWO2_01_FULL_39_24]|nr:MAG: hypothetical protein A2800_04945 [Candidatus Levybacteria bacterium RIFCSPHIGHO2_01_FULL_40_16]OGH28959.1 MAG: hypothetical protein A3E12_01285 [Candidatus Levybacteria bacterium RIFCSPHIGHO2_12_FULL_39_9]OGH46131.1 MAG: hypothetical protein A3B47_03595 [Candidatus Levybacteria bacterium RIFCSPLOWO2_01_FULL_39_24]HJZ06044.1 twin-arginine translocase TatA/TatE family subunit [Patescibacteria group bacterium]
MFNFIKNIGTTEIILIAIILLVIFGPRLIKMLGRTSGQTLKEVKNIKKEFTKAIEVDDNKPGKN